MARIGLLFVLAGVVAAAAAAWLLTTYEDPAVDPAWAVSESVAIPKGAVTVRWTGTATLVFSDGDTTWLTDGWFSRPGPLALLLSKIEPDVAAIEAGLARNRIDRAAAVFPVHSHYDHAMDAPEVARRTGAVLLGSESTANIGRGWGLPESQIQVVQDREPIRLGRFVVTPIESRHFQFPDPAMRERALSDPQIREPLVPPVDAFDYRLGKAYVLHVAHPLGRWLVVGSAGWVEGGLEGFEADVVFLGTGGLGSQTEEYREDYWRETVTRSRPARIVPIHWDSLTGPIQGPFTGPVRAAGLLASGGDRTLEFLKRKQREHRELRFLTLPRYDEVVLFAPPGAAASGAGASTRAGEQSAAARGSTTPAEAGPGAGDPIRGSLNRSPRAGRRVWSPRFGRDSRERVLEEEAATGALERNLIPPAVLRARVEQKLAGLETLPPDEQQRARDDAVRETAAEAAIGAYLSKRRSGRVTQTDLDMWDTLLSTLDDEDVGEILDEMEARGALSSDDSVSED